ncbi:MAG: hypothetical protein SFX18_14985 [Pirellulales bacterium]|nr:hypothetical protein [Pirellulales bacterium]
MLVLDGLDLAQRQHYYPLDRQMPLASVATARDNAKNTPTAVRISWAVIFLKAYAAVCARTPQLRQVYQRWPWPHLLETEDVTAQLVVNRSTPAGELLGWGAFRQPQMQPLRELQRQLELYQTEPVEKVYRKQVTLGRFPRWLRQWLWWWQLNFSGEKWAKRFGTFTLSTLAAQGCTNRFHPTMLTTSLTYGPLDEQGNACVTLICDHRVLDGLPASLALADLERELTGPIRNELRELARG